MQDTRRDDTDAISRDVARVLVSRRQIADRLVELGGELARCYRNRELTILAVLTGSLVFLADLIRQMPLRLRTDVVAVSSYPHRAVSSQGPKLKLDFSLDLAGKDVLIVDDILDSGATLSALIDMVSQAHPSSLRTCVMLRKDRPDLPDRVGVDFVGFDVEDDFVVGYGLDFDGLYRNLPDICSLSSEALAGAQGDRP